MFQKKIKSQVSMEFMFLIGFLFVIAIGFILAAGIKMKTVSDNHNKEIVENFGISIKEEIALASIVKEGYHRTLVLPDKIKETINYTITNSINTLIIKTEYLEYSTIIPETHGTIKKGNNIIKNVDGFVLIENV